MELTRSKILIIGMLLLLAGIQFRLVDTYVLNQDATQFIQSRIKRVDASAAVAARSWLPSMTHPPLQTWSPPRRLGWALISVGGVLVLYTLALRKHE